MKGDRERCLEAGMDGYLTKPIRPTDLVDVLADLSLGSGSIEEKTEDVFDADALLERLGDDRELQQELAQLFLEQTPRTLAEIHTALEQDRMDQLKHLAHSLKGSIRVFGAKAAAEAAEAMEKKASANDRNDLRKTETLLRQEVARLTKALERLAEAPAG
jgi:HPt (histidine-containing phosphotransfer) domain-containing protein